MSPPEDSWLDTCIPESELSFNKFSRSRFNQKENLVHLTRGRQQSEPKKRFALKATSSLVDAPASPDGINFSMVDWLNPDVEPNITKAFLDNETQLETFMSTCATTLNAGAANT